MQSDRPAYAVPLCAAARGSRPDVRGASRKKKEEACAELAQVQREAGRGMTKVMEAREEQEKLGCTRKGSSRSRPERSRRKWQRWRKW